MTAERAKDELADSVESYTLTIQERGDVTETITAEDIGLAYVDSGDVDRLLEQYNPYLWIIDKFRTHQLTASTDTTMDSAKAEQTVRGLNCLVNFEPMQDAKVVDDGTQFVVQDAVQGNQLDTEKTVQAILSALSSGPVSYTHLLRGLLSSVPS